MTDYNGPKKDTRQTGSRRPGEDTQPTRPPIDFPSPLPPQPLFTPQPPPPPLQRKQRRASRRRRRIPRGCLSVILAGIILLAIYFLLPFQTTILILGTDSRDPADPLGRTDTMILTRIDPLAPDVAMLSVPRDLWVSIPGYGENRINAAYFFGEAEATGSGVEVAYETLDLNFGVKMEYYALVKFNGIVDVVDAMGGLDIELPRAMSGYDQGSHHIDGTQALAFVRDRTGSDDFFRMERGQLFIRSMVRSFMNPLTWLRLPLVAAALPAAIETDLPIWHWPRVGLALLRAGPEGIDGRTITREMAVPYTTDAGASVLLPQWGLILPLVEEMFP